MGGSCPGFLRVNEKYELRDSTYWPLEARFHLETPTIPVDRRLGSLRRERALWVGRLRRRELDGEEYACALDGSG